MTAAELARYRRELEHAIAFFDRQAPVPPARADLQTGIAMMRLGEARDNGDADGVRRATAGVLGRVPQALQLALEFSGCGVLPPLFSRVSQPLNRNGTQGTDGVDGGVHSVLTGRWGSLHDLRDIF
jgi:hypothetical protein